MTPDTEPRLTCAEVAALFRRPGPQRVYATRQNGKLRLFPQPAEGLVYVGRYDATADVCELAEDVNRALMGAGR